MKKAYILSLGCPRNLADSEVLCGRLKKKGFSIVETPCADIGIVNTCAFIKDAKQESIDAILDLIQLKKEGKIKKVVVAGCLPQRFGSGLTKHLKEVDSFIGRISLHHHTGEHFRLTPPHFSYVKISEGCRNFCSYCIIPSIKGRYESRVRASIIDEAQKLDAAGAKEINIVGQDITLYGSDRHETQGLITLIRDILKHTKRIHWLRLLYLHPRRISVELLELIAHEPRICKYVDVPIQHCNDRILKLMNRQTTKRQITQCIERIRKIVPHVALRTSVIVGFPGETKEEFQELYDFIGQVQFERLGAFSYSREEGTRAYAMKPQISEKTKNARLDAIMRRQQEIAELVNSRFLGTTQEIIIDEIDKDGVYLGRTQFDAPEVDGMVYVHAKRKLSPGNFANVRITDTLEYDLVGDML